MDIYGVIGWPIEHSLSPVMHNAAFEKIGMKDKAKYIKIPVEPSQLEDFLLGKGVFKDTDGNSVQAKDVKGFNITVPHKVKARETLEKLFPKNEEDFENWYYVHITGAVNTVKRNGDKLEYINTDVEGFVKSLESDLNFNLGDGENKDKNVLLIGCGGAGRAVIAGLSYDFVETNINKIYLYDNNKTAVDLLKGHFLKLEKQWGDNLNNITEFIYNKQDIASKIKNCQLLVNATPIGMKEGDDRIIDKELLHDNLSVYDVVYNRQTQLVKDAREKKCKVVGGKGMLYYQGLYAFKFWFPHVKPLPTTTMREVLDKAIG